MPLICIISNSTLYIEDKFSLVTPLFLKPCSTTCATDADNFSWSGESFDIRNEKLRLNAYIEVGAGYSRAINERLTVGGKAKLLLGAGNINLNINQLYMYGKDAGIDSEFQLKTDAYLEASAKGLDLEEENGYITDLDYNSFGISGYGAGIDLGASYQVMKNLTVSAAILDLGFISWGKSSTQIAESVLFRVFSSKLSDDNTQRSKSTLERALTRSITQCYADPAGSGFWPAALMHLCHWLDLRDWIWLVSFRSCNHDLCVPGNPAESSNT